MIFNNRITAINPTNPELPRESIRVVTLPTTSIPNTGPPNNTWTKTPTDKKVISKSDTPVKNPLIIPKTFSILHFLLKV